MKSKIKQAMAYGTGLAAGLAANPSAIFAQPASLTDQANIYTTGNFAKLSTLKPSAFVAFLINFLLGVAGVIAFLFLLWGGLQWILAGGDKEGTEKARKKITSALIGLAIVFSAYALIFIVQAVFGIQLLEVQIANIV